MDAGTAAVVAGLGGVLLGNLGQIAQPWLADRRNRSTKERALRQAAYSSFLLAAAEVRLQSTFVGVKLEQKNADEAAIMESFRQRQVVEDAGLAAWLLAGRTVRQEIDKVLEALRMAARDATTVTEIDGKRSTRQTTWPELDGVRTAMRDELAA